MPIIRPSPSEKSIRSRMPAVTASPTRAAAARAPNWSSSAAARLSEAVIDNSSPVCRSVWMPAPVRIRRTALIRSRCASSYIPRERNQNPVRQAMVSTRNRPKIAITDTAIAAGSAVATARSMTVPIATGTSASQTWCSDQNSAPSAAARRCRRKIPRISRRVALRSGTMIHPKGED